MRFAGDLIRQGNPNDTISPQSADEVYRFQQHLRDKPTVPSFNAEDLVDTPEMAPGPYFSGQDLMRDKYIRSDPRSGVAQGFKDGQEVALAPAIPVAAGLIGKGLKVYGAVRLGQAALDGGGVNPGTKADYKNQDPTSQYNRHKQDADKNYMEIMKSGFI